MLLLIAPELFGKELRIIIHGDYLVDKSSAAKLSVESMSKHLIKAFLVMIVSMPAGIIDTTDIKHGIQCIKDLLQTDIANGGKQVSATARYNTNCCTCISTTDSKVMNKCIIHPCIRHCNGDSTAR